MSAGSIGNKQVNFNSVSIGNTPVYPSFVGLASSIATGISTIYIPTPSSAITSSNAPVSVLLQVPDGATQNWIVDARPVREASTSNWFIRTNFAQNISSANTIVSWGVGAPTYTTISALSTVTVG